MPSHTHSILMLDPATLKPLIVFFITVFQCLSIISFPFIFFVFSVFACLNILPWCDSVSVPQVGNPGKLQTGPVSAPSPASSPSHLHTAVEPRGAPRLHPDPPWRNRQGQRRRTFSCSPQRWASQTDQTRADSGTSELGLESDSSES